MIDRPGPRVELAGRLVGEQQVRAVGQRAGDRDALLLAARQLVRAVASAVGQTDQLEQLRDALVALAAVGRGRGAAAPRRSRPRTGSAAGRTPGR